MVQRREGRSPTPCRGQPSWRTVITFALIIVSCLKAFVIARGSPAVHVPPSLSNRWAVSSIRGDDGSHGSSPLALSSRGAALPPPWNPIQGILRIRGGSDEEDEGSGDSETDDDEEEDEVEVEDNDLDESSFVSEGRDGSTSFSALNLTKRAVVLAGKLTLRLVKTTSRVLLAAFKGDESEDDNDFKESTAAGKLVRAVQRMWRAIWNVEPEKKVFRSSLSSSDPPPTATTNKKRTTTPTKGLQKEVTDFGNYLSQAYSVEATRTQLDHAPPVLSGSLSEALTMARSEARLLVVLIPSSKPDSKHDMSADEEAIKGFLSLEVATVAERKARKKEETGSYFLWSAKPGSAEAAATLKRLKVATTNSRGQKRPVLLVAYSQLVVDRGVPKIVPRLLAQHHCSPPPSPELMAAWLNALRKRHAKQYATMQLERREGQLMKDRIEGYHGSIQSDRERQERERREQEQRLLEEKAELERQEALLVRRKELLISLPEEPPSTNAGSMTIALRFSDGRSSQRRFAPDTQLSTLFNWVDALFEMEREHITLTTLNGQKSFVWEGSEELTLTQAGFARMTGLRVTERKADASVSS